MAGTADSWPRGAEASIRATGRRGIVTIYDPQDKDDLVYKIAFADGADPQCDWFALCAVDVAPRRRPGAADGPAAPPPPLPAPPPPQPPDLLGLPPLFQLISKEVLRALGGMRNFKDHPEIPRKLKRRDLTPRFTDYEYVFLQVVGFARLHQQLDEILAKNNGKFYTENPATQLLERHCGFTMHADRHDVAGVLRSAAPSLLTGFKAQLRTREGPLRFFRSAFDRNAYPCLEGRLSRLQDYLEKQLGTLGLWEDLSLRPLPESATPRDIVGEHLRVFHGECTYRWASARGLTHQLGKEAVQKPQHAAEFERDYFNRARFERALRSKCVVTEAQAEEAIKYFVDLCTLPQLSEELNRPAVAAAAGRA